MNAWRSKDEFKARVFHWAEKLDIKVHTLAMRPMRNGIMFHSRESEL
jgi:hypothetical protein